MNKQQTHYNKLVVRYHRYKRKLERIQKQQQSVKCTKNEAWLINKLRQLFHQIMQLKRQIALASGLLICYTNATAQITFTERTGASNPLNGEDIGYYCSPAFVDLDNDGDFDMVSGESSGEFFYYENTGTATAPTLTQRTGASNPLNGEDIGGYSAPAFVDLDNDGDFDMVSGVNSGQFFYYENTGTATAPTFTQRTGASNPLNGEDIGSYSNPSFVDLDNDGDFDMVSGQGYGQFFYYENTGTATTPTFTQRTGTSNPLNGQNIGNYSDPTFADLDNDGDFDMISGESYGKFFYYENTGTVTAPTFTQRTGAGNPLNGEEAGIYCTPTFVDLDNDGDFDMISGDNYGEFVYYENTSAILPVGLLEFKAEVHENKVLLSWKTASETNNDYFTIEHSHDGVNWIKIAQVNGAGNSISVLSYSYTDTSPFVGTSYYRLKQTDFDGKYSYFSVKMVSTHNFYQPEFTPSPNPVDRQLTLIGYKESPEKVKIIDALGKEVTSLIHKIFHHNGNPVFDLSNLESGIYFIKAPGYTTKVYKQ